MTRYYNSSPQNRRSDSVSHNINSFSSLIFLVLVISILTSCEENPTTIGSNLLPGNDFVITKAIDTLSIFSYTMFDEAVRSNNPDTSYLGQTYDPFFGTTTAGFVSQVRLKYDWDGKPFVIDSMKLFLHVRSVRGGGTDVKHSMKISEITEHIYTDKEYYSNTSISTAYEIADIELPAILPDTINDLEITLPNSFGAYLTRDTSMLFHNNKIPDFRSFFKGLYFQLNPSPEPMLLSLSLVNGGTGGYNNIFVIFMHDDAGVQKEYYFILDANNKNAAFNKFSYDFSTALPGKKINHINDNFRDTLSYLQSLSGVYTRIVLPGLESLKNSTAFVNVGVNKARLTVPVFYDGTTYKESTVPSILYLRYRTKSGAKYVVPDYNMSPAKDPYSYFFNGRVDTTTNAYVFNIPSFVQRYLEDTSNEILPELELFQGSGSKNVILKANKSKTPVKFDFTFTKF